MSKSKQLLGFRSLMLIGVAASALVGWTSAPSLAADLTPQEAKKIAVDAYIYGYSLMTSDVTEKAFVNTVRARSQDVSGAAQSVGQYTEISAGRL